MIRVYDETRILALPLYSILQCVFPQNPDSERIRHAPRGSKSTVRSKILKFEPTFLNFRSISSGIPSFANSALFILAVFDRKRPRESASSVG